MTGSDHRIEVLARSERCCRWSTAEKRAPLIETAKLNDVEPMAYLTDVITRIANGHPNSQIDALLPWSYRTDKIPL